MYLSKEEHIRNRTLSAIASTCILLVLLAFFVCYKLVTPDPPFPMLPSNPGTEISFGILNAKTNTFEYDQIGAAPEVNYQEELLRSEESSVITTQRKQLSEVERLARRFKELKNKASIGFETGQQGDPNSNATTENSERGTNTPIKGIKFDLGTSELVHFPSLPKEITEEGKVVVNIAVDTNGNVIEAEPNGRGTTTSSALLKAKARQAALATKFSADAKNTERHGSITIIFAFD